MSEATGASRDVRRRLLVVALVVVVAVAVAIVWLRDHRRDEEWAHGGDGVDVTAQVQAASRSDYPDVMEAAGVPGEYPQPGAVEAFVVQVSWDAPDDDGSYAFVLLDDRLSPAKPLGASGSWGKGGGGPHWSGNYEALSEHYPWLAGTAAGRTPSGGFTSDNDALGLYPSAGEGVLSFYLPADSITTSHPEDDLVLAMVHTDDDGEVRWARKVSLT